MPYNAKADKKRTERAKHKRPHLVLVHINLQEHHFCQLFAQLLKRGGDPLAGTAPRRREIDDHEGVLAVGENLFELRLRGNLLHLLETIIPVWHVTQDAELSVYVCLLIDL